MTPGPTSPRRARFSDTSRGSTSPPGWSSRPRPSLPRSDKPVKILRVIARLNMGGPALHVAYLTEGLRKRGYETTLVAGSLARGEDSMAFVADAHGVEIVHIDELGREISPSTGSRRDDPAGATDPKGAAADPAHAHGQGRNRRARGRAARRLARPPIIVHTFHGHVLRGYFGPVRSSAFRTARALARLSSTRSSPSARRYVTTRRPGRRAARALRGDPARHRARRTRRPANRTAVPRAAATSASPTSGSPSAGSGA